MTPFDAHYWAMARAAVDIEVSRLYDLASPHLDPGGRIFNVHLRALRAVEDLLLPGPLAIALAHLRGVS